MRSCVPRLLRKHAWVDPEQGKRLVITLLDRCVESMREIAPSARNLQALVVAHLEDHPGAQETFDLVLNMVQDFLNDSGVRVLPLDVAAGQVRALRFRPSMGWLQMR